VPTVFPNHPSHPIRTVEASEPDWPCPVSDSPEPARESRVSLPWPLRRRENSIEAKRLSLTALSGQLRTTSSRYRSNAKAESNICQASAKDLVNPGRKTFRMR
jgi:hypothetical protein